MSSPETCAVVWLPRSPISRGYISGSEILWNKIRTLAYRSNPWDFSEFQGAIKHEVV